MADETKNDPAKRMRRLLTGGKTSPIIKLPKKDGSVVSALPKKDDDEKQKGDVKIAAPPALPKADQPSKSRGLNFGPPFWTIASVLSLTINLVLGIVLVSVLIGLSRSGLKVSNMINLGSSFLGGLYTNFEKMDRASIQTNVKVDTTIPVKFDLQLNQQTNVVLSQDVTINNARVTVNTGGLNITNALTTIVLPQGTNLPIVLNLSVPVDTTVPVTLNVPVNIPLNQTELHEPFTGLQDVVKPFYCMLAPSALNLDQQPICN
jgi:hypothetical protein